MDAVRRRDRQLAGHHPAAPGAGAAPEAGATEGPAVTDRAAFAALDPNAALAAPPAPPTPLSLAGPLGRVVEGLGVTNRPHPATLVATVRGRRRSRVRFFLFWCLLRLAARVHPFNFELRREPEPYREPTDAV
jgi:hypothetical protein